MTPSSNPTTLDPKPAPRVLEHTSSPVAAVKPKDALRVTCHLNPDPNAPIEPLVVYRQGQPNQSDIFTTYRLSSNEGSNDAFHHVLTFRKGNVSPKGVTNEALLAVVLDRLESAQAGKCPCDENAAAINHLWRALGSLHARTMRRCCEGTIGTQEEKPHEPATPEVVPAETGEGAASENAPGDVTPTASGEEATPGGHEKTTTVSEEADKEPAKEVEKVEEPVKPAPKNEPKKHPSHPHPKK